MDLTLTSNLDHDGVQERLNSYGYCVIPNFLSELECERLRLHIDNCMQKYSDKVQRDFKEGLGGDYRLFGLENTDKVIYDSLYNNPFFGILSLYTNNPETVPCTAMGGLIKAQEGITQINSGGSCHQDPPEFITQINSGGSWHRDPGTQYGTKVKTIIYLSDVGSGNGPLTIIPNSRLCDVGVGLFRTENCPRGHRGLRICDDFVEELSRGGIRPVEVLGKAGTIILVDVGNIHMGKPIQEGKRYSLTNYFGNNQKNSDSFKYNMKHYIYK